MLIRRQDDIAPSEITPEKLYRGRRAFLASAVPAALAIGSGAIFARGLAEHDDPAVRPKGRYDTDEKQTPYKDVTTYNNFYEFGTDKEDPAANAGSLRTSPWKISVEGLVKKTAVFDPDSLLKGMTPEDRIY